MTIVASGLLLIGCASGTTTIVPNNDPVSEVEVDEQVDLEVAPPEEDDSSSSADLGSRENPLPIGTTVILDDGMGGVWEVTLLPPTLEANAVVQEENMFNEAPPEGFQFALLPVTATYLGDETGMAAWDLDYAYVSAAGTTHKPFDVSVVIPDDLGNLNELYTGGVAEGNIAIAIPSDGARAGTWRISTSWGETAAFFAAQ